MQIIFLQDLGKFFKLKYCRWLCIDFLFSSVCMSHRELSDFFFSAICQPIRPSWAGWLIVSSLRPPPYRSLWHSSQGQLCVTWYSGSSTLWYGSSGNPLRDHVLLFWLLNMHIDNNTIGRHLSWFGSYCTCIFKMSGGPWFLPNYQAKGKSKEEEKW